MKIGLISAYDIAVPSGVNSHVAQLARELRRRGHGVRIVAPGPRTAERAPGTTIIGRAVPIPAGGSLARVAIAPWLGPSVAALLARERFDVVHIHEPLISTLTLHVLRASRAVNVGTFHTAREGGSWGYALSRFVLRRSFERLDGHIAVSPSAARLICRYFPARYQVIPNGIDLDRFAAPAPRPAGLQDGRPYVLFVGRFEPRKGLPVLLRAYVRLKRRFPSLGLVVVGDGGRRGRYEQWMAARGVPDVRFVGRVSDDELPGYYQHAAVFCAPNTGNESFGIVLLEAMAAGCPVVATTIEGFAAVVTPDVDGLLVPPGDPASLSAAIERVLDSPSLARVFADRGRERARQFAWPDVALRVLAYYEQLLDARPRRKRAAACPVLDRTRTPQD